MTRVVVFLAATGVGVTLWMLYNYICFENPFIPGKLRPGLLQHPSGERNAFLGLAGLLVSPGKSVFLYSPTVILGLLGFSRLYEREKWLGAVIPLVTVIHMAFIASMVFWHGDWCWGPRYLVVLLPLWALAFPFAVPRGRVRLMVVALIVIGVVVQLLGLGLVHERFFHERGLGAFFWAEDRGFYFRESALVARISEIWEPAAQGVPSEARYFSHTPGHRLLTYFIMGFPRPEEAPQQMRLYKVFYLPRPWPFWVDHLDPQLHTSPLNGSLWIPVLLVAGSLGGLIVWRTCKEVTPVHD